MADKINTVHESVEVNKSVDLDHALAIAGIGWYNLKYSFALATFLIAAIVEPVGYSFVLPAAMCDLNMSDSQRGLIASIPYIGIVITSFPWGYLLDTQGRKRVLIYSSLAAGFFGMVSAFMPNLISFAACKFLTSLCIACPAAAPYTYIGEIIPGKHKDLLLTVTNALQVLGAALVPLFAWAILPLDFRIDFGAYDFRPWRLLSIVNASTFIVCAILMSFGPESPKYLVSQGKLDEALEVIQKIYVGNKRKSGKNFPITQLEVPPDNRQKVNFFTSLKVQSWPLLKPPYLKWMCLNGFLLFGTFSTLNGLYSWVPDILNRVFTGDGGDRTACDVIFDRLNQTSAEDAECNDTIDQMTFIISTLANVCCAVIAVAVSSTVKLIGKKRLLVVVFLLIGIFCILVNFTRQTMLFAVLLSTIPLLGLSIGPINAYAVDIFPVHLRGMAVGLSMMIGRTGSIVGANVAGALLNAACEVTFYLFGGLLIFCAVLTFFLPKAQGAPTKKTKESIADITKL